MKIVLCIAAMLSSATLLQAASRVFTSTDGKTITAELTSANGLQATLKLADGRETVVPLNRLCQADQLYIADWLKKNPQEIRYNFSVDADKEKMDSKTTGSRSIMTTSTSKWLYHVKVTNRASQPVDGLKMRFQIHYVDEEGKAKSTEYKFGVKDIPTLKPGESTMVDTDPVELITTQMQDGWMHGDGARARQADTIKGIAVTLEHDGKSVFEFATTGVKKVSQSEGTDPKKRTP
jgi:hypothetical protein